MPAPFYPVSVGAGGAFTLEEAANLVAHYEQAATAAENDGDQGRGDYYHRQAMRLLASIGKAAIEGRLMHHA